VTHLPLETEEPVALQLLQRRRAKPADAPKLERRPQK
jgi:hypothetical protein